MQLSSSTVALVTGGGSGLGGATARRLVDDGATVVIVDLEGSAAPALVEELEGRRAGSAVFGVADVRDEPQVQAAIDRATSLGELRRRQLCRRRHARAGRRPRGS